MENRRLVAYQYGAEKHQLYLNHYERHFASLSEGNIKLLELGIYKGGSLLQWRDFFPNGKIVGLDLDPIDIKDPAGKIITYQGDQTDLALLDRIASECAHDGFDIIIDDASHIAALTKISFWHLFDKHLRPGGYYVIEDWRVSYWEASPDGSKYQWPDPTPAQSPQISQPMQTSQAMPTSQATQTSQATPTSQAIVPESRLLHYSDRMARSVKKILDAMGTEAVAGVAGRVYRNIRHKSRRFPSHDYGMVGLIKQLMDELGMDAITNPDRNGFPPQRFPKFQRMEVCPGQVFIVKATAQDKDLVADSLGHRFPGVSASESRPVVTVG